MSGPELHRCLASVAIWGQHWRAGRAVPANRRVSMEISVMFSRHVSAPRRIQRLDGVHVVFFAVCARLTNGLRSRGRALARAGTCVGMQAVCVLDSARVLCACVGKRAPACLAAGRPACMRVRACLRACSRMWTCARAGMSADVPSNPAVGLLWISRRLQGMGIPLPFTALPGCEVGKEGWRLSPAASPPQPQGVIEAVGLSFQQYVFVEKEWLCTLCWL